MLNKSTTYGNSDPSTDEWPMYHGSLDHVGATTTTPVQGIDALWKFHTGSWVDYSSPAVVGGRVFIGCADSNIYCLNATTGKKFWNYSTHGSVRSTPAIAMERVYVGSRDYQVYCLDVFTGALYWNFTTGEKVDSSPAIAGGHVFVGSDDNNTYCLDAITGGLIWSFKTGGAVESSPAVVNGRVYVGSDDHKLYCLNATTKTIIWSYKTGNFVASSPAITNGCVYVGSGDSKVYCLNATNGALIWASFNMGPSLGSSPAVSNERIYIASNSNIYCLNATTGGKLWNYTMGTYTCSPAVAGNYVYVGGELGSLPNSTYPTFYCFNATSGAVVWSYPVGWILGSSPAIARGYVYVGGCGEAVYCLPMLLPGPQSIDPVVLISIAIVVIAGALTGVVIVIMYHRKARTRGFPSVAQSTRQLKTKSNLQPSKPFTLYCQLCDRRTTMDGDYIVSGTETCETCGEPMHFMAKCGKCGRVLIKPVAEFAAFTRTGMICLQCGAKMIFT